MESCKFEPAPEEYHYIFFKYITTPKGVTLYAEHYGKKAFRILVKD